MHTIFMFVINSLDKLFACVCESEITVMTDIYNFCETESACREGNWKRMGSPLVSWEKMTLKI